MKYSVIILLIAVITTKIIAQTYGLDNADINSFFRYRIPETDLRRIAVNTDLSFSSTKNIFSNSIQDNNSLNSSLHYTLSPDYYIIKESDNRYFSLNCNLTGGYDRQYYKTENSTTQIFTNSLVTSYNESETREDRYQENFLLTSNFRNYINGSELFYAASTNILVGIYDTYLTQSSTFSSSPKDNEYTGSKTQTYIFSLGFGWGKYRNVTPVVSAIRFQERLKQLNLLNGNLSSRVIEDLAEQFNRYSYYSDIHDRPEKYFWQDIEKILVNDNLLPLGSLSQYASAYLREVPNEYRFLRIEGLISGIDLDVRYFNNYYHNPGISIPASSIISEDLFTLGNIYIQYSHQLNLDSQLGLNFSLSAGPNLIKNSTDRQMYQMNTKLSYDYELTDRIVTSVKNTFGLTFKNSYLQKKQLTNDLTFNINYFIEDNLSFLGSYQLVYNDWKNQYGDQRNNITTNNYINFGLTYFFDKGFLL